MFESINLFLQEVRPGLNKSRKRLAIAFHNESKLKPDDINQFIDAIQADSKLILSSMLENALLAERAATVLGEEYDLVVFDASENFNVDALGVVSGVLCGGGVLIIILPDTAHWRKQQSLYLKYVNTMLNNESGICYLKNNLSVQYNVELMSESTHNSHEIDCIEPYRTRDQQQSVELIKSNINETDKCCMVLTSGRGRGKSSSLGLLSAQLIQQGKAKILVTAPRLTVTKPMFNRLQQQCKEGTFNRGCFKYKDASVDFIAPDALLESLQFADILLIDEAAAIPLSMLGQLLAHYPKIIFSTTTHGYEGTGRGFIIKFYKLLDELRPGWKEIKLHQPIRWSKDDQLEKWIEELLFLNVQLGVKPEESSNIEKCQLSLINREMLIKDKMKLSCLFSLLVYAHYRTSPSDFQYILDSENVRLYTLEFKEQILGVLVINQEGGFDEGLSTAIYRGERRPRGHLLAQTLCFHAGYEAAASMKYSRVMRISIHPEIQRCGYGSFLLQGVIEAEKTYGVDVIGSSFSANVPLLNFWSKAGLSILRLGFSRDHVSASHSAVVAFAYSENGKKLIDELSNKFLNNFNIWLMGPLSDLSENIKLYVYKIKKNNEFNFSEIDKRDIESFANYKRNYEACMPAITRWLDSVQAILPKLSPEDQQVIKSSMLYKNSWSDIVKALACSGKKEALFKLRCALKRLLKIKAD